MTKYNLETKYKSVKAYLNDNEFFSLIAKRIGTHRSNIKEWVESYNENGIYGLKIKHKKKQYDLKFKLKVIKYYQNHNEGQITVGAKFNINRSQIHSWVKKFNFYGIDGLRPSPKGRPPKMKISKKKKNNNL